jgi:formylmethanofuran dehydrogenase subunit E
MGKIKDDIWSTFGQSYKQGDAKSSYYKCSACDEPVIATMNRMCDHWAKCKKCPHAIGQLDVGF